MTAALAHDCVGALLVRNGRVLLGRRAEDREWLPGAWDVFGGHVEPGEDGADALRRELAEELGIAPLALRDLGVLEDAGSEAWRLRVYAVTAWRGEVRNRQPDEHAELRWCTPAEAVERLAPAHPGFERLIAAATVTAGR
jgi:8-oxo-dGTP diphosphatase